MKVLLNKEELHDGVTRMADEIAACYENQHLTIIGILTSLALPAYQDYTVRTKNVGSDPGADFVPRQHH